MNNFIILDKNLIDLSIAVTPASVLQELSKILETGSFKGEKVRLILGDILITPENVFSLKSITELAGVELEVIYSTSLNTQLAALSAGLVVSEKIPTLETSELNQESADSEDIENIETIENIEILETTVQEIDEQYETEKALEDILDQEEIQEESPKKQDFRTKNLYLKQTLRSGQTVNFDGNVIIIGDSHPGSEVIAAGDITVWGILGGVAHAGAKGDYNSSIRALKINAIQLRIANLYARKPDRLDFEKIERTETFIPEEARISNGEIKIYSLNG